MIFLALTYLSVLIVLAFVTIYVLVKLFSHNPRKPHPSELTYITNHKNPTELPLPLKNNESYDSIKLSVVIPCFNESNRLPKMLNESITFLEENYSKKYEILIVDDGSKDNTTNLALEIANEYKLTPGTMRVVKLVKNRGKGGAVTHGLQFIRGEFGLFVDADGASLFSDVSKLLEVGEKLKAGGNGAVVIGSRAHMINTDAVVKRSFIRNFLMYCLHTLVFIFGIRSIKDTQCGFKLFDKFAIERIFPFMHTERWIFDVEILILAIRQKIPIEEVPISWHEVSGSKIDLARDSIQMAIDLVVTRLAYIFGIYKDVKQKKE